MNANPTIMETVVQTISSASDLARSLVMAVQEDGTVLVAARDSESGDLACEVLCTGAAPPTLVRGDAVLVWQPDPTVNRGIVMGRIGPSHSPQPEPQPADVPDQLVIEAREKLVLKCGDGSVTLRGDGKVLIRGKDLVTRAQRMNRIKGGAVAIN